MVSAVLKNRNSFHAIFMLSKIYRQFLQIALYNICNVVLIQCAGITCTVKICTRINRIIII